jgi:oligoendopeptidase F
MSNNEMVWDLSQLVENEDPKYIEERLKASVKEAEMLRDKHRGKIETYNAEDILHMLEEIDDLTLNYNGEYRYAFLVYAADMSTDISKKLNDVRLQAFMQLNQALAFVEVELGRRLSMDPSLIDDSTLTEYKHHLERIYRKVPFILSESEEMIVLAKDRNGKSAWYQFFGDWLATRMFDIEVDGELKSLPYGEIISFYESPNRDLRKRAHQVVFSGLAKDQLLWSSVLRAVLADHIETCKIRKWPSPMTQSLIINDVDQESIDSLMSIMQKNTTSLQRYLQLKAKVMGLDILGNWDVMAPLPGTPEKKYSWNESRKLVTDAYMRFDRQSGEWIDEMYEKRHIDAEVRKGKRSGAFCSSWYSGKSAYVLQSFTGILGNVFTQAHELGHALHAYLCTRAQTPFNLQYSYCIAEVGSIFGELLLTEKLIGMAESNEEKRVLLAKVLDEFSDTAFQVSVRVFFETSLYDALKEGEVLDGEKISELWIKARDSIFGDAVEWLSEMKWWWCMKLHFYLSYMRYYNYPYVFAQLFVYAMYRLYKEQGQEFVPKLKALLAAGSSNSPRELAAEIGFDITKEEFWQKGINQYVEFIDMFEETLK